MSKNLGFVVGQAQSSLGLASTPDLKSLGW